jgi:6-pyruvoyltetrahydropterin/6-carboxytetrahydropterin synthase
MIATITKDFAFSASHQLLYLPDEHQCARLHGHNYLVRVEIEGSVGRVGFVFDYGDLREFGQYIDGTLDHRHLNDVLCDNPTAEHLARHLAVILRKVIRNINQQYQHPLSIAVSISETPKTWATYREKW